MFVLVLIRVSHMIQFTACKKTLHWLKVCDQLVLSWRCVLMEEGGAGLHTYTYTRVHATDKSKLKMQQRLVPSAVDSGGKSQTDLCFMQPAFNGRLAENKEQPGTRDPQRTIRREITGDNGAAFDICLSTSNAQVCACSQCVFSRDKLYMWLTKQRRT